MKHPLALISVFALSVTATPAAEPLKLTRADYADRAHATWVAQIAGVYLGFPHEHRTVSVEWLSEYPKPYTSAIVDDDWYYEMSALRAFEKHGPAMTIQQLGEQWKVDVCGTWGSSKEARLNMARGVLPPDCGHPRYNRSWWTIGPQFSAEIAALAYEGGADRFAYKCGLWVLKCVDGVTSIANDERFTPRSY